MRKIIFTLTVLASISAFADQLCLNEVASAAYNYTLKNLQSNTEIVHSTASSAVNSIDMTGGVNSDTIYQVKLSGRRVTSKGMIVGPASFAVEVYVDNSNCEISQINH